MLINHPPETLMINQKVADLGVVSQTINQAPETLKKNQLVVNLNQESQAAKNQASNHLAVNQNHLHQEPLVTIVASVPFAISL